MLMLGAGLSGCVAGPDYQAPGAEKLGVPPHYSVLSDPAAQSRDPRWWTALNDPVLTRIEAEGMAANLDLAMAVARLRQSREALVQARSTLLPTLSASATASGTRSLTGGGTTTIGFGTAGTGSSGNSLSMSVDAAYQVDLFGGRSRSIEAARADAAGSRFDYGAVALTIQSDIATAYLQVRLQQTNLVNARMARTNQADALQIADWRNQAGLVSLLDVEAARSQLALTTATIPPIDSALNTAIARLGVLTGREPGALKPELAVVLPIPVGPADITVGVPADIVRQRPDVRVAERSLAGATARIGVAAAQLRPALSLGGSLTSGAGSISGLVDAISGQAFATLAQTLFDGGRLRSLVRAQRAATDGALANYHQVVLIALEEAENAIVALHNANLRQAELDRAQAAATRSAELARDQYRSGLIDFAALIVTENLLVTARNGAVQARYDRAAALVGLFAALGGGWTDRDTVPGQDK
jgi:NodT family efflux transporter outer membrane factor (OMF) lipoprotein